MQQFKTVIPAKAGISPEQRDYIGFMNDCVRVPAFAGMTIFLFIKEPIVQVCDATEAD